MPELDISSRRAGSPIAPVRSTSAGRPETWSACTCVSNTADDRRPDPLCRREVVVDEVHVRVDDGELVVRSCSRTDSSHMSPTSFRNGRSSIGRLLSARDLDRQSGTTPLRETDVQSARLQSALAQQPDGVVRVDAVGAAAVGDDLAPPRQLRQQGSEARPAAPSVPQRCVRRDTRAPDGHRAQRLGRAPAAARAPPPKVARPRRAPPGTRPPAPTLRRRDATATSRIAAQRSATRSLASR